MADAQRAVQDVLDELTSSAAERGIQVAAYVGGEQVVDAVAGVADPATGRPVTPATVFYNFSIGKGLIATLVHQQVDSGTLSYDTRLAELWPAFAQRGKEKVTVRHVLTHSAGLPGVPLDATIDDVCTWQTMTRALERAELWWEPGTGVGYHAYTFGFLAGEVVRRVTGRSLGAVLREDLAARIGHPDELWFGMPPAEQHRLAALEDESPTAGWSPQGVPADSPILRAGPSSLAPTAALGNDPRVLAADLPATGKVSARAIAKMYAALQHDVDGTRLISEERFREASAVAARGIDQVFGNDSAWALGFAVGCPGLEDDGSHVIGMAGAGGSWAGLDVTRGLSLAITRNTLSSGFDTVARVAKAVRAQL